ncbi:MAG: sporulation integral membrane protein YtvI [Clostridia bacterium]|nr:sporulation integral membrane protein YtvI [Clostridia bacterium]
MEKRNYTEWAARIFCLLVGVFFIWFLFEYTLGVLFPFAIGFAIGVPIHLLSGKITKNRKLAHKLCASLLLIVLIAALIMLIGALLNRLLLEAESLLEWLQSEESGFSERISSFLDSLNKLSSNIPFIAELEKIEGLEGLGESIDERLSAMLDGFVSNLASGVPALALKLAKNTPRILIGIVVGALASFYFATDYSGIKQSVSDSLSPNLREKLSRVWGVSGSALKKYLRAYLLIMLITFAEVSVGLLILRVPYAFLIALGVALVDMLPIFGTGAVLIPWAIVSFILKDVGTATGLLIIYGVATIVREVIEPKIIGASLGIHPLITLFAMFASLRFFGVAGLLLSPFILIMIKEIRGIYSP